MVNQNAAFQVEMEGSNSVIQALSAIVERLDVLNETMSSVNMGKQFKAVATDMSASSKLISSSLNATSKNFQKATKSASTYTKALDTNSKSSKKASKSSTNSNRSMLEGRPRLPSGMSSGLSSMRPNRSSLGYSSSRSSLGGYNLFGGSSSGRYRGGDQNSVTGVSQTLKDLNDELKEAKKNLGTDLELTGNSVEDIKNSIKELKKAFKKSTSVEDVSKQIAKLTKEKERLNETFNKSTDPLVRGEAQLRYQEASEKIDALTSSLKDQRDMMATNIVGQTSIESLSSQIAELKKQQEGLSDTYASSNDPIVRGEAQEKYQEAADKLDALNKQLAYQKDLLYTDIKGQSSIEKLEAQIASLKEEQNGLSESFSASNDPIVRGEAQEKYQEAADKLERLNDQLETQKNLLTTSISGKSSIAQLTQQIAALKDKQKELSDTYASSNDPIVRGEAQEKYQKAADKVDELNSQLEDYQNLLTSDISGRTGIDALVKQIDDLKSKQKDLSKVYKSTNDPFLRGEAQEKYQKAGDKLERLNELLAEQKKLSSTNIEGKTNLQVFGEYAQEAATMINSTESFMSTIKMSASNFTAATQEFKLGNEVINTTKVTYGDLLLVISGGLEKLSSTAARAEEISAKLSNMSAKFNNWSTQLSSASSSLSNIGSAAEGAAGSAAASSGAIRILGKVMGTTTEEAGAMAAGLAGNVATGLGAVGTALGTIAAVVGPVLLIIEAVKIGFDVLNTLMGTTEENINKNNEAILNEIQKRQDLNDLIESGDIETLNRQRATIKKNIAAKREEIEALKKSQVTNADLISQARTSINQIFGNSYVFGATADKVREMEGELSNLNSELDDLASPTLDNAIKGIAKYNEMLKVGEDAISDLTDRENELLQLRVDAITASTKHSKEVQDMELEYDKETTSITETRNQDEIDRLKNHLKDMNDLTTGYDKDVLKATEDHLKELADEEETYRKSVADALVEYNKELATIAEDYRQSVIDEEIQWTEERQADYLDHQKSLAKMDEDFNKAEIQRKKDLQQQLWEAELDNDALQYFKLQRQGDKDAKEALDAQKESIDEENKTYAEGQADKVKEREKSRAEALAEAEKSRAEKMAQFEEDRKQSREDHLKSMDDMRKGFADALAEQKANYENERALRAQQFQDKETSIRLDYLKEDKLRQDQQDKRRTELHDQYLLELKYFADRDSLLTNYINEMNLAKQKPEAILESVRSEPISSPEIKKSLHDQLLAGFNDLYLEYPTMSESEQINYNVILDLIKTLEDRPDVNLDIREWFTKTEDAGIADAFNDVLDRSVKVIAGNLAQGYAPYLGTGGNIPTPEETQAILQMNQLGNVSPLDLIFTRLKGTEDTQGYIGVNGTLTTGAEYEDQMRREREITAIGGIDNVDQLRRDAHDLNTDVISANNQATLAIREQQTNLLLTNTKHFGYMNEDVGQFYDEQLALLEQQNIDALSTDAQGNVNLLSQDTEYMKNAGGVLGAGYDTMLTMGSDYHSDSYLQTDTANAAALEQEAGYVSDISTLNADANVAALDSQMTHNNEMLGQADQYSSDLNKTVTRGYNGTIQSIVSESRSGTQAAAALYKTLNTEIVSSVARAIAQVRIMNSGTGTSVRTNLTNRSTSFGFGGLHGRSVLAAKGAFVDRPTSLIAGEGNSPEVIFPFDESKGVPNDILGGIGKGLISGLSERSLYGGMNANISTPNNTDAILKAMLTALNGLQVGMELNIQSVAVGGDISRTEIQQQFSKMQRAIVDAVWSSVQGTLS